MRIEGVVIEAEAIGRIARPGSGRAAQAWWRAASREVDGTSSSSTTGWLVLHFWSRRSSSSRRLRINSLCISAARALRL